MVYTIDLRSAQDSKTLIHSHRRKFKQWVLHCLSVLLDPQYLSISRPILELPGICLHHLTAITEFDSLFAFYSQYLLCLLRIIILMNILTRSSRVHGINSLPSLLNIILNGEKPIQSGLFNIG
jgi:hypothetical protein